MSMFQKRYLLTPGPTMIPPAVTEARAKQLPHHRTPQFKELIRDIHEDLKYLFQTEHDVYSLTTSGTGAMEASVATVLSTGDEVIVVDGGKFGARWVKICKCYGIEVIPVAVERGRAVDPQAISEALKKHPRAKAVLTHLTETSTGCTYDLETIGPIVAKSDALLIVDSISGLGAEPFRPDAWGVDAAVAGSQKGIMLPPGLGFASLSPRAWEAAKTATCPCFYLDLRRYREGYAEGYHPFTPSIGLYIQLAEAMKMIRQETIEGMWRRHAWLARATQAGVAALGLELFAQRPSNVLTAVKVPKGVEANRLLGIMRDDLGVTIAGGQEELQGKIMRIGHLGYIDRFDILSAISALEIALKRTGYQVTLGSGITAAEQVIAEEQVET